MSAPDALDCRDVSVAYDGADVLHGLGLAVGSGETLAMLGPSGSGKTTLLHAVAGFVPVRDGEIRIAGAVASAPGRTAPPERRDVGLVFQSYALWPHLSAVETVAYPLRRAGLGRRDAHEHARRLLDRMGVAELADRFPDQLSGGQQQRIGLARALARRARLYLLDEPTAHLDAPLRASLQVEMTEVRREVGAAAVYATHDAAEALAVADRVALLRDGRVVQLGRPVDVYERPVDLWAAELTGPASVLDFTLVRAAGEAVEARVGEHEGSVPVDGGRLPWGDALPLLVRPDWVELVDVTAPAAFPARIRSTAYRGPHTDYVLETPAGDLVVRTAGTPRHPVGAAVGWTLTQAWPLPVNRPR